MSNCENEFFNQQQRMAYSQSRLAIPPGDMSGVRNVGKYRNAMPPNISVEYQNGPQLLAQQRNSASESMSRQPVSYQRRRPNGTGDEDYVQWHGQDPPQISQHGNFHQQYRNGVVYAPPQGQVSYSSVPRSFQGGEHGSTQTTSPQYQRHGARLPYNDSQLVDFQERHYPDRYQRGQPPSLDGMIGNQRDAFTAMRKQNKAVSDRRPLIEPESPENISWDNPFPTFPSNKNKGARKGDAASNLRKDSREKTTQGQTPQSANSKISQTAPQRVYQGNFHGKGQHREKEFVRGDGVYQMSRYECLQDGHMDPGNMLAEQNLVQKKQHQVKEQMQELELNNQPIQYHQRFEGRNTIPSSSATTPLPVIYPRSNTLPSEVSQSMMHQDVRYSPKTTRNESQLQVEVQGIHKGNILFNQPYNSSELPNSSRTRSQPQGTRSEGNFEAQRSLQRLHDAQQEKYVDVFDSYYEEPRPTIHPASKVAVNQSRFPGEEEMPNFAAMSSPSPNQLHFQFKQTTPNAQATLMTSAQGVSNYPAWSRPVRTQAYQSRSQPNMRAQLLAGAVTNNGISNEAAQNVPEMPQIPQQLLCVQGIDGFMNGWGSDNIEASSNRPVATTERQFRLAYDTHAYPAELPQIQGFGSLSATQKIAQNNWQANSAQVEDPSIISGLNSRIGPKSPPQSRQENSRSLSEHPAPICHGSVQEHVPYQAPRPLPVRQYNSGPSPGFRISNSAKSMTSPPPNGGQKAITVTHEELGRLRQAMKSNPDDQKTQLLLARKMVEAASVLSDEGGRADPKTRNRNREKYVFDALKLVKKLVSNGCTDATFYLADCYGRGMLGLETDPKEAFILYQSAAKASHAQSAYRVAVCYEMGQEEGGGTRRDPLKAVQWYKRAATLGDTPAIYKMGMIQLKGLLGQARNPREAIVWLKRAAELADEENPHALHELGLLYESESGNDSIIKDEAYSKQLFTQAADLGYKFSQYRLGTAYEYGLMGCPIDPRQSIAWYSKAAVQEEHQSELALSGWYLTGSEGVLQQSDTEAYLWARKAAHTGLAKAEYAMGYFTEVGIGVTANIEDAKRWYWRAASQNLPKAQERLEHLRKGGALMQKSRVSRSAVNKQSEGECAVM